MTHRNIFYILEKIREHKLEFFAIMATGSSNFWLPNLAGGFDYQWYCLYPLGGWGDLTWHQHRLATRAKN
jgi:hypothetical protein